MPLPTVNSVTPPERIWGLESIRGLAALMIVFYHTPSWNSEIRPSALDNAYVLVDLFFVLSGFLLYRSYGHSLRSGSQLARFTLLRIGRIYPLHLVFLLVFLLIEIAKYLAAEHLGIHSPNTHPFQENSGTAFLQNLLLIQSIGPTGNTTTFNYPAWSISVELSAYLLFGGVCLLAGRLRTALFTGLAGGCTLILLTITIDGYDPLLRCLAGFFFGCITAQALQTFSVKGLTRPPAAIISMMALLLFIVFKPEKSLDPLIYPLTSLMIATVALSEDSALHRGSRHRWLISLGTVSYSLYMSHAAVLWTVNQAIRLLMHPPEAIVNKSSAPQLPAGTAAALCGLSLLLCFLLSALIYRYIEAPSRTSSRLLTDRLFPAQG